MDAPSNGMDFDQVDDVVQGNHMYREVFRVVRLLAAQPSCDRMVLVLEKHAKYMLRADVVRVLLVTRHGFTHPNLTQALPLNLGLASHSTYKREIINMTIPPGDERYHPEVDSITDRGVSPFAYLCVPVEADSRSDCTGPKDVVALIQAWRDNSTTNAPTATPPTAFTTTDAKMLLRLGEFSGNMLRGSRSADRAHALYNASLSSQQRSVALLDVAKALANETRLDSVVSIIVSQVPELLDCDRCTLFFVDKEKEELIVTRGASKGRQISLVSWVFGQSNAPELPFPPGQNEIRFSMRNGIAGHCGM